MEIDWEARACEAAKEIAALRLTMMGMIAGAGGRIVVEPRDLHDLPRMAMHRYERPESGAVVYELVRT